MPNRSENRKQRLFAQLVKLSDVASRVFASHKISELPI